MCHGSFSFIYQPPMSLLATPEINLKDDKTHKLLLILMQLFSKRKYTNGMSMCVCNRLFLSDSHQIVVNFKTLII